MRGKKSAGKAAVRACSLEKLIADTMNVLKLHGSTPKAICFPRASPRRRKKIHTKLPKNRIP
jgi:hypothetical protein